jgi:hypothetical protein
MEGFCGLSCGAGYVVKDAKVVLQLFFFLFTWLEKRDAGAETRF